MPLSASASPSEVPGRGAFTLSAPSSPPPPPQMTVLIKAHRHGNENRGYRGGEGDSGFNVRQTAFPLRSDHEKAQGVKETLLSREPGMLARLRVSATCTHNRYKAATWCICHVCV